jgi:hypothetical protein
MHAKQKALLNLFNMMGNDTLLKKKKVTKYGRDQLAGCPNIHLFMYNQPIIRKM